MLTKLPTAATRRPSLEVVPLTARQAESRVRVLAGDLDAADAATIVAAHHAALREGPGVLKDAPGSAVTRIHVPAGELCVKQYRVRGWFDRAKALLRSSRTV